MPSDSNSAIILALRSSDKSPLKHTLPGEHWRDEKPYWHKEWLEHEYVTLGKSTGDIAKEWNITCAAIIYWLRKHNIPRRGISEARSKKHWGQHGSDNPMWNKRGELNPRWKGGITPDRQSFYTSQEWKSACRRVWKRDNARCQRCGLTKRSNPDMPMHIHHIVSFSNKELRASIDNLVLLCEVCHHWVHSKRNKNNEYLR